MVHRTTSFMTVFLYFSGVEALFYNFARIQRFIVLPLLVNLVDGGAFWCALAQLDVMDPALMGYVFRTRLQWLGYLLKPLADHLDTCRVFYFFFCGVAKLQLPLRLTVCQTKQLETCVRLALHTLNTGIFQLSTKICRRSTSMNGKNLHEHLRAPMLIIHRFIRRCWEVTVARRGCWWFLLARML